MSVQHSSPYGFPPFESQREVMARTTRRAGIAPHHTSCRARARQREPQGRVRWALPIAVLAANVMGSDCFQNPAATGVGISHAKLLLFYDDKCEDSYNQPVAPTTRKATEVGQPGLTEATSGKSRNEAVLSRRQRRKLQRAVLDEADRDLIRRTTLGDIMSERRRRRSSPLSRDAMLTHPTTFDSVSSREWNGLDPSSLAALYGITHPLDRMALTANGNLQRLVSSFYDAPVSVVVESCALRSTAESSLEEREWIHPESYNGHFSNQDQVWDRVVHLQVHDRVFCTARSEITVRDPYCQDLVQSGEIGLGQLFRYLDILPMFTLHDAGRSPQNDLSIAGCADFTSSSNLHSAFQGPEYCSGGGGFWRDYSLDCSELSCRIHESFVPEMWTLHPPHEAPPNVSPP
jgi:hypothetical protein